MAELNVARRHRGMAISLITQVEKHVLELEGKGKRSLKDEVVMGTSKDLRTFMQTSRVFIAGSSTWLRMTRNSCWKNKPS